jgi:hypothetical protein
MDDFVLECTNQYTDLRLSAANERWRSTYGAQFETFNYGHRIHWSAGKRQTGFVV